MPLCPFCTWPLSAALISCELLFLSFLGHSPFLGALPLCFLLCLSYISLHLNVAVLVPLPFLCYVSTRLRIASDSVSVSVVSLPSVLSSVGFCLLSLCSVFCLCCLSLCPLSLVLSSVSVLCCFGDPVHHGRRR